MFDSHQFDPVFPDFSRSDFSIEEVSPLIREASRNNFSLLLRKMSEQSLDNIGDKLHLHKSNVSRMKENGSLQKVAAILVALDLDVESLIKENEELKRQCSALQVIAHSNLSKALGV